MCASSLIASSLGWAACSRATPSGGPRSNETGRSQRWWLSWWEGWTKIVPSQEGFKGEPKFYQGGGYHGEKREPKYYHDVSYHGEKGEPKYYQDGDFHGEKGEPKYYLDGCYHGEKGEPKSYHDGCYHGEKGEPKYYKDGGIYSGGYVLHSYCISIQEINFFCSVHV